MERNEQGEEAQPSADSYSDIAAMNPAATTTTPTTTPTTTTTTTTGKFSSPLKRKRGIEIPETPWRLQPASAPEDDEEEKELVEVEDEGDGETLVTSGQVSPGSRKLASQLEDLNLGGKIVGPLFKLLQGGDDVMDTATVEQPAAKKMKRKGRATKGMARYEDGNGSVNGHIDKDGEEGSTGDKENTKRARLRSPPLSKTKDPDASEDDGVAVVDESEDLDSDDQEQLGIGYRPTPTQRYVRSQKRMQQIKEYKARISKEARERRSETRRKRRRSFPGGNTAASALGETNSDEGGRKKTVQFKIDPVI